jgi:hypothetical protein
MTHLVSSLERETGFAIEALKKHRNDPIIDTRPPEASI